MELPTRNASKQETCADQADRWLEFHTLTVAMGQKLCHVIGSVERAALPHEEWGLHLSLPLSLPASVTKALLQQILQLLELELAFPRPSSRNGTAIIGDDE